MRKQFFIPAIIISVIAIVYIVAILINPSLTIPFEAGVKGLIYGAVLDAIAVLLVMAFVDLAFLKKEYIIALAIELLAIVLICLSIAVGGRENGSNWYLAFGLLGNGIAMLLNAIARKKYAVKEDESES